MRVTKRLSCTRGAPAQARAALAPLRKRLSVGAYHDLVLLISELVTNSVRHAQLGAQEKIGLKVVLSDELVRAGVVDPGVGFSMTELPEPGGLDGSGFGLHLVGKIAERWGVERERGVTRVWFELARG